MSILFLILSLGSSRVLAGELETALQKGDNIFMYLYTAECKYCQLFKPNYDELLQKYNKDFVFVKVDTTTLYGQKLMFTYQVRYVPYVAMINGKTKNGMQIAPSCLLNYKCLDTAVKSFKENKI